MSKFKLKPLHYAGIYFSSVLIFGAGFFIYGNYQKKEITPPAPQFVVEEPKSETELIVKDVIPSKPVVNATEFSDFVFKASRTKDPEVFFQIGDLYEQGEIVGAENVSSAYEWYFRAAELGHAEASYRLGLIYSNTNSLPAQREAYDRFEFAAKNGFALAELEVANMLSEGIVVDMDLERAFRLYKSAADKGLADAALNLAQMYQKGAGVDQNPELAVQYYAMAAEQGQNQAQYNLGIAYYTGYGVDKNWFKAKEWLTKALMGGNKDAAIILQEILVV